MKLRAYALSQEYDVSKLSCIFFSLFFPTLSQLGKALSNFGDKKNPLSLLRVSYQILYAPSFRLLKLRSEYLLPFYGFYRVIVSLRSV